LDLDIDLDKLTDEEKLQFYKKYDVKIEDILEVTDEFILNKLISNLYSNPINLLITVFKIMNNLKNVKFVYYPLDFYEEINNLLILKNNKTINILFKTEASYYNRGNYLAFVEGGYYRQGISEKLKESKFSKASLYNIQNCNFEYILNAGLGKFSYGLMTPKLSDETVNEKITNFYSELSKKHEFDINKANSSLVYISNVSDEKFILLNFIKLILDYNVIGENSLHNILIIKSKKILDILDSIEFQTEINNFTINPLDLILDYLLITSNPSLKGFSELSDMPQMKKVYQSKATFKYDSTLKQIEGTYILNDGSIEIKKINLIIIEPIFKTTHSFLFVDLLKESHPYCLISGDSSYQEALYLNKYAIHSGSKHKINMVEDILNLIIEKFLGKSLIDYMEYLFKLNPEIKLISFIEYFKEINSELKQTLLMIFTRRNIDTNLSFVDLLKDIKREKGDFDTEFLRRLELIKSNPLLNDPIDCTNDKALPFEKGMNYLIGNINKHESVLNNLTFGKSALHNQFFDKFYVSLESLTKYFEKNIF